MHKVGQAAPVPLPPNPLTNSNPLTTGLQVGALGAAAGLGWAAIHRSIRMKAGDKTPVAVVKPMLVGALIGSALGTAAGMAGRGRGMTPRKPSWEGVEQDIMNRTAEYKGLGAIVDKQAMVKRGLSVGGELANAATYFIPGVGQVRMGYDALSSFGGALGSLFKGNFREAGGKALSGLGSTAMLAGSAFGGQYIAGGVKALRAGRAAAAAGKAAKPAFGLAERMGRVVGPHIGEGTLNSMDRASSVMRGVKPRAYTAPGEQMQFATNAKGNFTNNQWMNKGQRRAMNIASLPLYVGGAMVEGAPDQQMPAAPAAAVRAFSPSRWGIKPTAMPEINIPEALRKYSQAQDEYSSMLYNPALGSRTLTDLYMAIRADSGVPIMDKGELINQIKAMTGYQSDSTPISSLMIHGLGGTIGWLISRYFGMGPVGQVMSAVGGFGIGTVINNQLNKPPSQYPGYRALGE